MSTQISVEVVYATSTKQYCATIKLVQGSLLIDALRQSDVLDMFPEIDLDNYPVGIFSRIASHDTKLSDGDRVEIYRKLIDNKYVQQPTK